MTPSRLSELKELAEKATDKHIRSGVRNFWGDRCAEYDPACNTCLAWKEIDDGAAARTAVPELVAEVERLTGLLSEAIDEVESWAGYAPEWAKEKWSFNEILNDLRARAALGGQP